MQYSPTTVGLSAASANFGRFPSVALACLLSWLGLLSAVSAQDPYEDVEFRRGLTGTYRSASVTFQRLDPAIDFDWTLQAENRLPSGPFQVEWSGLLMSQATGTYRFHAFVQGRVQVKLRGQLLLEAEHAEPTWISSEELRLPFDWHPLQISFAAPQDEARLSLFWQGPKFGLEPIPERHYFHDPLESPALAELTGYDRGAELVQALRCAACHDWSPAHARSPQSEVLAAPSLVHAAATLKPDWIARWLTNREATKLEIRRMPHFELSAEQAEQITAFLVSQKTKVDLQEKVEEPLTEKQLREGRTLFLSVGCLACHQYEGLGNGGIYGGGDLTQIARKRPAGFFESWLRAPEKLNEQHRMPVFELTAPERKLLADFLAHSGQDQAVRTPDADKSPQQPSEQQVAKGRKLFVSMRCQACHQSRAPVEDNLAGGQGSLARIPLSDDSDWQHACTTAAPSAQRPGYALAEEDADAVRTFITEQSRRNASSAAGQLSGTAHSPDGRQLMRQHNCTTCHARTDRGGLAEIVDQIAADYPQLAADVPAMTPPSLLSVGDKLHDSALKDSITRKSGVHRPWLTVRMPRFHLTPAELDSISQHLISADRIPAGAPRSDGPSGAGPSGERHSESPSVDSAAIELAGPRLVSTDGFGCTSCHRVGKVKPPKAPLNARGPDLLSLGKRIRKPWFDRWVRNPARIVPRMEMPSVEVAVGGVLDEDLDKQLQAVWETLNRPGFVPPKPNPVQVLRLSGIADREERAVVVTDVVRVGQNSFVKPMLIGLPNRHTVLFDLQTARLQRWALGDTARQRTEGKTWFWGAAGVPLFEENVPNADISLDLATGPVEAIALGQFATEFDAYTHRDRGLVVEYRLHFPAAALNEDGKDEAGKTSGGDDSRETQSISVHQAFLPRFASPTSVAGDAGRHGFDRLVKVDRIPAQATPLLSLVPTSSQKYRVQEEGRVLLLDDTGSVRIRILEPAGVSIDERGAVRLQPENGSALVHVRYETDLPVDQFPVVSPLPLPAEAEQLNVVPGFQATRLPITEELMPTGLDWDGQGRLYVTSLKGRVWRLDDRDEDGLGETLSAFSDPLAAPFGVVARPPGFKTPADTTSVKAIDVINKYALLRLIDEDGDGRAERTETLASGWGHTIDYHDWTIGIPTDKEGNYYLSIACQQDERTDAGAYLRGTVVKAVPRTPTAEDPRAFELDLLSGGHRFPVGIARNEHGELFVTDNQGNYNPFNELNHVQRGARYGFINRNERKPGFNPPLTPPAIDIPHPWTRSVNGICFLETPDNETTQQNFGVFEGHLVGCEYDTRRLIRMSLQEVDGTMQGAAYPLSLYHPTDGKTFLGPITCAVSPSGELYVGCIRDSGWGGANNIGGIVRLQFDPDRLPAGIAEVTAKPTGFVITFTRPVDTARAIEASNYSVSSYRRISTPSYGGPDVDRRKDAITSVRSLGSARDAQTTQVFLEMGDWREGFVYEIRCKPLVDDEQEFFPAEAYYTLRRAPGTVENR